MSDVQSMQGTGDGVRFDLRKSEGNVKNRRLGKRDATLLIKDVWREKDVYDTSQVFPQCCFVQLNS